MRHVSTVLTLATIFVGLAPPLEAIDWTSLFVTLSEIEAAAAASESGVAAGMTADSEEASAEPGDDAPGEHSSGRRADIKAEFDRICGQVQMAPELTDQELRTLIEDCKALREKLLASDLPQAKIYLKRIRMCQDFFQYSLDVRAEK